MTNLKKNQKFEINYNQDEGSVSDDEEFEEEKIEIYENFMETQSKSNDSSEDY